MVQGKTKKFAVLYHGVSLCAALLAPEEKSQKEYRPGPKSFMFCIKSTDLVLKVSCSV